MKVKVRKIILPYSWLPTGTYHKNLPNWNYFLESGIWAIFPMKNPLYRLKKYFSGQNLE
jgi:hypothetical protein